MKKTLFLLALASQCLYGASSRPRQRPILMREPLGCTPIDLRALPTIIARDRAIALFGSERERSELRNNLVNNYAYVEYRSTLQNARNLLNQFEVPHPVEHTKTWLDWLIAQGSCCRSIADLTTSDDPTSGYPHELPNSGALIHSITAGVANSTIFYYTRDERLQAAPHVFRDPAYLKILQEARTIVDRLGIDDRR